MRSSFRRADLAAPSIVVLLGLAAAGCGGDSTAPRPPGGPLTIVAGADVSDTVQAQPIQALVVQVRESNGAPARGVVVRFEPQSVQASPYGYVPSIYVSSLTSTNFSNFVADQTDSSGRAAVLVQLGTYAGPAGIVVKVPELGLVDTARYTVKPGNAARLVMHVRDTVLYVGGQYSIGGTATDRFGNPRPGDAVGYTAVSSNVSVSAAGVVTTAAEGRAAIAVKAGTATDTARVSVVPHGTIVYIQSNPRGVAIVNLDGSGHRFLYPASYDSYFPQWSFDGKSIVLWEGSAGSDSRLTMVGIDSTSRTVMQIPHDTLVGMAWPRFAPDGSIFFGGITSGTGQIVWQVHADGTGLAEIAGSNGNGNFQHPAVSPDGRTLLFDEAQSAGGGLAAMDLATGTTTSVGMGAWPSYSPDGSKIAYLANYKVMVADANGANARPITPPGVYVQEYSAPSWSADGAWVFIPGAPSVLVRVSDGSSMPLPFTNGFSEPALR